MKLWCVTYLTFTFSFNALMQWMVYIQKAIQHAEKALIFEHGQYGSKILIENTVSTSTYSCTDIYKIINEGDRFELNEIVDMNEYEETPV